MHSGNYILVLHTHLPWVMNHGSWPHGEDWLMEAAAECYIPLLNIFNELKDEGILPKVTLDISPVLCEQLEHKKFSAKFIDYCNEKIKAASEDEKNFKKRGHDPHQVYLAEFWQDWYENRKTDFTGKFNKSVVNGLKELQDCGAIEIMTCGATHGYFPLLGYDESINLQVKAAVENYKKHFGREPRGIWLPECAYRPTYDWQSLIPVNPFHKKHLRPGVEQFLARHNIKYFITDEDLIKRIKPIGAFIDDLNEDFQSLDSEGFDNRMYNFDASPLKIYNVSSSEKTEYGTAAVFSRHHKIAMQVWSGDMGYPAEPDYLDFHKKHYDSKLRYWRVTDSKADMMYKTLYHPDHIMDKIDHQTNHFIHQLENTVNYYKNQTGRFATLCTPFDTELFGHWWFEGPLFIKSLIKGIHYSPYINCATAYEQLIKVAPKEVVMLPEGSWGENNNHDVWSNDENKWTWEADYNDEKRIKELLAEFAQVKSDQIMSRIMKQAIRELMLLQASDWQFLIHTGAARDYAEQRFSFHHNDFNKLCDLLENYSNSGVLTTEEQTYLEETEERNCPFPELKPEWWNYEI